MNKGKLARNKEIARKKKEDQVTNLLTTIQKNQSFIKLLMYSMRSLDILLTHPNREIKINAKVIIELGGIQVLKDIIIININNEEVTKLASDILFKLINFNEKFDAEYCGLFVEKGGHEAVMEILMHNPNSSTAKTLVKILHGLTQQPQLIQKLIDSGIVEAVKFVNDIYSDPEIITNNFEIMKKITNFKTGRDFVIKKGLIPNLIKNIIKVAEMNNSKGVLAGLGVVDNISKSEEGKENLRRNNVMEKLADILDKYSQDEQISQMGSKIFSKISNKNDLQQFLDDLRKFHTAGDYSELKTPLNISNFISSLALVDENARILNNPENVGLIFDVLEDLLNLNLANCSPEYLEKYLKLMKKFMIIVDRMYQNDKNLFFLVPKSKNLILSTLPKTIDAVKENIRLLNPPKDQEINGLFNEYLVAFSDNYNNLNEQSLVSNSDSGKVIDFINKEQVFLKNDPNFNLAATNILKIDVDRSDPIVQEKVNSSLPYLLDILNISDVPKTLENATEVIYKIIARSPQINEASAKTIINPILKFMLDKPKHRLPNLNCLKTINHLTNNKNTLDSIKKDENIDLLTPIISVLAKNEFSTSEILKVINLDQNSESNLIDEKDKNGELIESLIKAEGSQLFEKLIDENYLKKLIKILRDQSENYNQQSNTSDFLLQLETTLLFFLSMLKSKDIPQVYLDQILPSLKTLLKKEIAANESVNNDPAKEKDPKYENRILMETGIVKLIADSEKKYILSEPTKEKRISSAIGLKDSYLTLLYSLDKCTNDNVLKSSIKAIDSHVDFLLENHEIIDTIVTKPSNDVFNKNPNDPIIESITSKLVGVIRKSPNDDAIKEVLETLIKMAKANSNVCDSLVKAGAIRILMQIAEENSNPEIVKLALELLKLITKSSQQNLEVVSNQNILEKLLDINSKFSNDNDIKRISNEIINELSKLKGQGDIIADNLKSCIQELKDLNKLNKYDENKQNILNCLEKINVFTTGPKLIEPLNHDKEFILALDNITKQSLNDPETNNLNQNLIDNEFAVIRKLKDNTNDPNAPIIEKSIIHDIKAIDNKSQYRDIFLGALKSLSAGLNQESTKNRIIQKLDENFVDNLINKQENYADDIEVSSEIKNLLNNICKNSRALSSRIVSKTGLEALMDEIRSLLKMNDEASNSTKVSGLNFINALCKDKTYVKKFVDANGEGLIKDILKYELKRENERLKKISFYCTYHVFTINPIISGQKNDKIILSLKLLHKVMKENKEYKLDQNLRKSINELIDINYPDIYLLKKAMKIINFNLDNFNSSYNEDEKKGLIQVLFSYDSYFFTDSKVKEFANTCLYLIEYNDQRLFEILAFLSEKRVDSELVKLFQDKNNIGTFLTFFALYGENNINNFKDHYNIKDYSDFIKAMLTNLIQFINTEGGLIAVIKILQNYINFSDEAKQGLKSNFKFDEVILKSGLDYLTIANHKYFYYFINEMDKLFNLVGKNSFGKIYPFYLNYLEKLENKSIDIYSQYSHLIEKKENIDFYFDSLVSQINKIVIEYLSEDSSNINQNMAKKLAENLLYLVESQDVSLQRKLEFWKILELLLKSDINNVILSNNNLSKKLLDSWFDTRKNSEDETLDRVLVNFSEKMKSDKDDIERILKYLNEDIPRNMYSQDEISERKLENDLKALSNILRFPIAAKMLVKQKEASDTLIDLFVKPNINKNCYIQLAKIIDEYSKNCQNDDLIKLGEKALKNPLTDHLLNYKENDFENKKDLIKNELDTFLNITTENFPEMEKKGVITKDEFLEVLKKYLNFPEFQERIQKLYKDFTNLDEENKKLEQANRLREESVRILAEARAIEEQNRIEFLDKENSEMKSSRTSLRGSDLKVRQSLTSEVQLRTSQKLNNQPTNEIKKILKSPLSSKDNVRIPYKIDEIIAFLKKVEKELNSTNDPKRINEHNEIIKNLLDALEIYAGSNDNHQPIIELGYLDFVEEFSKDKEKSPKNYAQALEILKKCLSNPDSVKNLVSNPCFDILLDDAMKYYENPKLIDSNDDQKAIFTSLNGIVSQILSNEEGRNALFEKIGIKKLLDIAKYTDLLEILIAILESMLNYVKSGNDTNPIFEEVTMILDKCIRFPRKNSLLMTLTYLNIGEYYNEKRMPQINKLGVIRSMIVEFESYKGSEEFLNSVIFCLGKITLNNVVNSAETLDSGLISKILFNNFLSKHIGNTFLMENLSGLFCHLLINQKNNIARFCQNHFPVDVLIILDKYKNTLHNQLLMNCVTIINLITNADDGIQYLTETKFSSIWFQVMDIKMNIPEMINICLDTLEKYYSKEIKTNIKNLDSETIVNLIAKLQKNYYSNSAILTSISTICGNLIRLVKDRGLKEKLYNFINDSIKIQDYNTALVITNLKLIYEILSKNFISPDDVFEITMYSMFNLLSQHTDFDVVYLCYLILSLFAKNYVYSYMMVNNGLIDKIKNTLEGELKNKPEITSKLYQLMNSVATDLNNSKKISEVLMDKFLADLALPEASNSHNDILNLIQTITKHKNCIEPFVQYKGIETLSNLLKNNTNSVDFILSAFKTLNNVCEGGDDYRKLMVDAKIPEIVTEIINTSGKLDKAIEYEGRTLIFNINSVRTKEMAKLEEINFKAVKVDNPIKPEIKNFLISGKIIKFYKSNGDKKTFHFSFTQDLLKFSFKIPGKNIPPKAKYVFETNNVNQIIKGHGTPAFKKHGGLFSKVPPAEKCFSIIGNTTVDGAKSFNIECDTPDDTNRWVQYLEIVVSFFKKNNSGLKKMKTTKI